MNSIKRRQQAIAALNAMRENGDANTERDIRNYLDLLEGTMNEAFNLLAAEGRMDYRVIEAQRLLGAALGKPKAENTR